MVRDARSRAGTLLLCLAAAFIPAGGPARGGQPAPGALSEYQIKAAYLYYFSTFVDWPPEAFSRGREPLVVGVLGVDPFGAILDDTLRGKAVNDRPLIVRRFQNIKDARDSHVLFISSSERDRLPSILKALEGAAVLTVGDIDRFAPRGGQIAFRMEDKKVRFDINVAAVERARLKISAQLMKLGRIVEEAGRQGG
ncbi:MAG TPA: YfiR family protein [Candidatus Dormibacteraeota bacterium]|nr:YfiR family protein [Candidatus Dormibacteraeota bacterium]